MTDIPQDTAQATADLAADARRIMENALRETLELGETDRGSIPAYAIETVKSAAETWLMLKAAAEREARATAKPATGEELAAAVYDFVGNAPGLENATNLADHVVGILAAAGQARGEQA